VWIPPQLARNVTGAWGDDGRDWLHGLPALLADVLNRWHLHAGEPFALSYHRVMAVTRADGQPAVLKLGVPASAASPGTCTAFRATVRCPGAG
jgi:streptomycin 6-kinase